MEEEFLGLAPGRHHAPQIHEGLYRFRRSRFICRNLTPGSTLLFVTPALRINALLNPRSGYPTLSPRPQVVRLEAEHMQIFKDLRPIAEAINAFIDRLRTS